MDTNRKLSVTNASSAPALLDGRRRVMLEQMITRGLAACLRDQLDDIAMDAAVAAWAELLGDVPADQLNACYLDAWKRSEHKPGFPVTADEILAAYQERRNRPRPLPQAADVIAQLRAHRYARKSDE